MTTYAQPEEYIEYEDLAFELKKKFGYKSVVVAYHLLNAFNIKALKSREGIKFAGVIQEDGSILAPTSIEGVASLIEKRIAEVFAIDHK